LIISILWFGSGWNMSLGIGGGLVAVGTILYNSSEKPKKEKVE
jgi:drug/metabolite transporter (DMT)-like permease